MSAATVIIPTAKAASSPKIRKRMMVSPYLPPVVVTARITLLVVSFHNQPVAIPALPWFKQRNFMLADLTDASPASASMTSKMEHARSAWGE
jgi:hypothetical protein